MRRPLMARRWQPPDPLTRRMKTNSGTPTARPAAGTPLPLEDPLRAAQAAQQEHDEAPASVLFEHGRLLEQHHLAGAHAKRRMSDELRRASPAEAALATLLGLRARVAASILQLPLCRRPCPWPLLTLWHAGDTEASVHLLQQLTRSRDGCQARGSHQRQGSARGSDPRGAVPTAQRISAAQEKPGVWPGRHALWRRKIIF